MLARFLKGRGKRNVTDIQPQDLDQYMAVIFEAGVQMSTRQARASVIRAFFRWLTENGRLLSNPARDIAMPANDDDVPLAEPPLEEAEVAELIDGLPRRHAVDLRNRLHLELLYGCGLRIGESVALDLRDIDLDARTVRVRGKGNKERILPLMRGVVAALRDYLALRRSLLKGPDHGALLLDNRGRRLKASAFRDWLDVLNRRRGPGKPYLHPHLFRHSIAVHLLRGGADIRHIQEFLGHAKLDVTKRYLRLVPGRLKEDYDKAMPEIAVTA
jgi:site-specific recombinase XerD